MCKGAADVSRLARTAYAWGDRIKTSDFTMFLNSAKRSARFLADVQVRSVRALVAGAQHRAMSKETKIIYTLTDEAPALATFSLLPILRRFIDPAGIKVESSDISVASRILAQFNDKLPADQQEPDNLAALGELCKTPEAIVIKLPNVSASIPQLNEAITELQSQGYKIPNFPQVPKTPEEEEIKARYSKVPFSQGVISIHAGLCPWILAEAERVVLIACFGACFRCRGVSHFLGPAIGGMLSALSFL